MNANLYGGGYKHFDIDAFIAVVASQEWQDRESVQLFIKGEEPDTWTILELAEE